MTFPDNNEKKERLEQNVKALSIRKKKTNINRRNCFLF